MAGPVSIHGAIRDGAVRVRREFADSSHRTPVTEPRVIGVLLERHWREAHSHDAVNSARSVADAYHPHPCHSFARDRVRHNGRHPYRGVRPTRSGTFDGMVCRRVPWMCRSRLPFPLAGGVHYRGCGEGHHDLSPGDRSLVPPRAGGVVPRSHLWFGCGCCREPNDRLAEQETPGGRIRDRGQNPASAGCRRAWAPSTTPLRRETL
jgi:hypothetical protein